MSELKHTCCAEVGSGFMYYPCGKTAKVERDNKWYCGTHDPVAVRERQVKRNTEWRTKMDAVYAAQRKRDAEEKEKKRRADLYPELLEALKMTRAVLQSINDMGAKSPITDTLWMPSGHETLFDFIDASIAKAEGKT